MHEKRGGARAARIAALNDRFRQRGIGGRKFLTRGVDARGFAFIIAAMQAVRAFDAFTPDNDPYGEHDFGSIELAGTKLFWKIDYYDAAMEHASPDPADPAVTTRVMTVMLAEEY